MEKIDELPADARTLAAAFCDGAQQALEGRLVSLLLLGSVAFPGFQPHYADIDFHCIVEEALRGEDEDALARMHAGLACAYALGPLLDGYYMPLEKVGPEPPQQLHGVARGRLNRSGANRDRGGWALERAHIEAGAFVLLAGRDPRPIYPPPAHEELEAALEEELGELAAVLERHPVYSTLNLCRLVYSIETGEVVVSKVVAGEWAASRLPAEWRPLVRDALALYRGEPRAAHLAERLPRFYRYVAAQYFTRTR
jgi:Domain of unknown function (DUF4111)